MHASSRRDQSVHSRSHHKAPHRRSSAHASREIEPRRRVTHGQYAKRKAQERRNPFIVAAVLVAALVLCGAGVAFGYYSVLSGNLHSGVDQDLLDALVETDLDDEPFYMLLLGTDASEERDETGDYGDQYRSDTIILARVDPVEGTITLVSIYRDTLVDMGDYGQNKINTAYALGGAALMVEVVSELAGVPISHYAEIDFDGFRDIVDALGGIEVDVPMEIDDEDAGGHLDAGLQTLDGDQALILCRSRHTYDDYGNGDTYRASNQRLVLAAIADKVLSADVATMANTVTTISEYVTTDLELTDIIGLAQSFQGFSSATDLYTGMEPTTSEYIYGGWYEIVDDEAWAEMMARVDAGLPPTEEDVVDETAGAILASTGSGELVDDDGNLSGGEVKVVYSATVAIRNGNGITGAAAEAATLIEDLGFYVDLGDANGTDYAETVVVYKDADDAEGAQAIVDTLGVGQVLADEGVYLFEEDILVVLGADWE